MQPLRGSPGEWYAVLTDKDALISERREDYHTFLSNLTELMLKKAIQLSTKWSRDRLDVTPIIQKSDDPHQRKTSQERKEDREDDQMVNELIEVAKDQRKRIARIKGRDREGKPLLPENDPY